MGRPHEYAAELRDAAGLERRRGLIAFVRARRPLNVILTVTVLTVIGLAIGTVVWVRSYQPLAVANLQEFPAGSVDAPAGDSASVVFHRGRPFQFGLEIRNAGRYTVRVRGVPYGSVVPFKARLFVEGPSLRYPGDYSSVVRRFRPFDLKPGHTAVLMLRGVYANCSKWPGAGSSTLFTDFPVRYSFLWRTATAEIPLHEELAIVFKKTNNCR